MPTQFVISMNNTKGKDMVQDYGMSEQFQVEGLY